MLCGLKKQRRPRPRFGAEPFRRAGAARMRSSRRRAMALYACAAPLVVAAFNTSEVLSSIRAWTLLVIGFSFVIFVHELGHFLAAKWAGVRVERFAIGFGKELFGFSRRGTRYSFNVLPLGGYVKMLGQEDFVVDKSGELKVRDDPASFTNKSIGRRMIVVSAGVVMNLLFAAVAFTIVVMVGRPEQPAIVGQVIDNTPAARAGLMTGDRIVAVNGRPVASFDEFRSAVVLSDPDERLILDVVRDGKAVRPKPEVVPEFQKDRQLRQIGISGGMNRRVWKIVLPPLPEPGSGTLQPDDELHQLRTGGQWRQLRDLSAFRRAIVEARGDPVEVIVRRPRDPAHLTDDLRTRADADISTDEVQVRLRAVWLLLPEDIDDIGSAHLLGLVPRLTVLGVTSRKAFDRAGAEPGDVITRVGGDPYPTYGSIKQQIEENAGRPIRLEVRRGAAANKGLSAAAVGWCVRHRESIIAEAHADPAAALARVRELLDSSDLPVADRASLIEKLAGLGDRSAWRRWLEEVDVHTLEPLVPRQPFALLGPRPPPPIDAALFHFDEGAVVVADVREKLGDRTSPARAAGIPVGAVIVGADGRPVRNWSDLSRIFAERADSNVKLRYRVGDDYFETTINVPDCLPAALKLPFGARIVAIDGKTSHRVVRAPGKVDRYELPDPRAVTGILQACVGRTVNVQYYTADGARHTSQYRVTDENIDPWLARVIYTEPFACYPLAEVHAVANPFKAMVIGFRKAYDKTAETIQSIRHLIFTRQVGFNNVQGPVGIIRIGGAAAGASVLDLLWFLAVISANLAVINFLPMPIVDGGLFLFLILEKLRGEPISIRMQVATQIVGIALIGTVFLLVTYQDIRNWITGA